MKKLTIKINTIPGRQPDRGIILKEFKFLKDLKHDPIWCAEIGGNYISKYNRKRNGMCYIPIKELNLIDCYYIGLYNMKFKFNIFEIGYDYVSVLLDVAKNETKNKKQLKKT